MNDEISEKRMRKAEERAQKSLEEECDNIRREYGISDELYGFMEGQYFCAHHDLEELVIEKLKTEINQEISDALAAYTGKILRMMLDIAVLAKKQ